MDLRAYIEAIGDEAAAEKFGVKPRTAASWRRRERMPRPEMSAVIVERTNGEVSYAEIYSQPEDKDAAA